MMELSERFWSSSVEELKRGYVEEKNHFVCLLCGHQLEKGIIYPNGDKLYEAEKYICVHIENNHYSVFEYLIQLDKKLTGLTEQQNRLLHLFYQGKTDKEIQQELGVGSTSTIRHHRFVLKEKERQARLFLTIMELLKEKDQHAPTFVAPHQTARMVDDRYNVTEKERENILKKFFPEGTEVRLKAFPPKEKQRWIVLREIARKFTSGHMYGEQDVNQLLQEVYPDYVLLRRYLLEYGFLDRKADGSQYWLKK